MVLIPGLFRPRAIPAKPLRTFAGIAPESCFLAHYPTPKRVASAGEAAFSSGHYLREYHGKCENPHGHNYRVLVTLAGKELDCSGLLIDFKELKQLLRPLVEYLDHTMINELEPFTVLNPSAENLAWYFFDQTNTRLLDLTKGRVRVVQSTVFETDSSAATYKE